MMGIITTRLPFFTLITIISSYPIAGKPRASDFDWNLPGFNRTTILYIILIKQSSCTFAMDQ